MLQCSSEYLKDETDRKFKFQKVLSGRYNSHCKRSNDDPIDKLESSLSLKYAMLKSKLLETNADYIQQSII